MDQYLTPNGCPCPLAMRSLAQRPMVGSLQYSTQSDISSGVPVPALVHRYGAAPSFRHSSMNSSVPNALLSSTHQALSKAGILSRPTPSFQ